MKLVPAYEAQIVALIALLKNSIWIEICQTLGDILETLTKNFKKVLP